jgi:hypothetical protein
MSFLDSIIDVGSSIWRSVTGPGTGAAIARAASLGLLLKEVTDSINKENQRPTASRNNRPDPGVRLQVDPNPENAIPVVYGQAWLGGIVTDARMSANNQTMWFCITICEKTGVKIDGSPSVITFEEISWNGLKLTFKSDGITALKVTDYEGNESTDIDGLVRVYCYNNGSGSPVVPFGYTNNSLVSANGIMPSWTPEHTMDDLVFAIVRVDYNRDKNITALGDVKFKIKNTMSQPGDVIFDYMTNTRYGAGIPAEEIYSQ